MKLALEVTKDEIATHFAEKQWVIGDLRIKVDPPIGHIHSATDSALLFDREPFMHVYSSGWAFNGVPIPDLEQAMREAKEYAAEMRQRIHDAVQFLRGRED